MRNWDEYPELGKHVTKENREKTRLLYPEIYERIKEKNISAIRMLSILSIDLGCDI